MSFEVRISKAAQEDLQHLLDFLAPVNYSAALHARAASERGYGFLEKMPFACRKADDANAFLRELVIPFGEAGYVALFGKPGRRKLSSGLGRGNRDGGS